MCIYFVSDEIGWTDHGSMCTGAGPHINVYVELSEYKMRPAFVWAWHRSLNTDSFVCCKCQKGEARSKAVVATVCGSIGAYRGLVQQS
jgi:hypothetical protein